MVLELTKHSVAKFQQLIEMKNSRTFLEKFTIFSKKFSNTLFLNYIGKFSQYSVAKFHNKIEIKN